MNKRNMIFRSKIIYPRSIAKLLLNWIEYKSYIRFKGNIIYSNTWKK